MLLFLLVSELLLLFVPQQAFCSTVYYPWCLRLCLVAVDNVWGWLVVAVHLVLMREVPAGLMPYWCLACEHVLYLRADGADKRLVTLVVLWGMAGQQCLDSFPRALCDRFRYMAVEDRRRVG